MSWWVKNVESFYRPPESAYTSKRATIICDTPQDLPAYNERQSDENDPFILMYGSDADVISNGRKYILNGSNQWIIQPQSGGGGGSSEAIDINYDNTQSGLSATNVQAAIDELEDEIDSIVPGGDVDAEDVGYNNITSGLTATNVQDAIDEVVDSVESVETTANTALQPSDVVSTYSPTGTDPVNGTAVASALSNSGFITAGTTLAHYGIADAYISGGTITLGNNSITPGTSNFSGAFNDLTGKPTTLAGYGITDASISNGTITLGNNTLTPGTSNFSGAFVDLTGKPTTLSGYGITDANISSGVITLGSDTITPLTASDVTSTYNALGTDPVNGIAVAAALAGGGGGEKWETFGANKLTSDSGFSTGYFFGYCINGLCILAGTFNITKINWSSVPYQFSSVYRINDSRFYPPSGTGTGNLSWNAATSTYCSGYTNVTTLANSLVSIDTFGQISFYFGYSGRPTGSASQTVTVTFSITYPALERTEDGEFIPRS